MMLAAARVRSRQLLAAIRSIRQAILLNPRGVIEQGMLAMANLRAGRDREAVEILERNRALQPDALPARVILANYDEGAGEHARARELVAEILAVDPDLTASQIPELSVVALMGPDFAAAAEANLRQAGLLDGTASP